MNIQRQSNFELLRILSIILVLGNHANFFSLGRPETNYIYDWDVFDFTRVFLQSIFIVSVNCFIFISGWFKIKNPTKSVFNVLYQYVFFAIIVGIFQSSFNTSFSFNYFIQSLKPGEAQWFVFSYLILCVLSPVLNKHLENSSKKEQTIVLLLFLFLQLAFGWINDYILINNGYSVLFFMFIYLLANYLRQFSSTIRIFCLSKYCDILIFFTFVFINTLWSSINEYTFLGGKGALFAYNSPSSILSTIYLCLFFSKLEFRSRLVNFIAKSSFSVYLLHTNPLILAPLWVPFWVGIWEQSKLLYYLVLPFVICNVLLISLIIDIIRGYTWNKLDSVCIKKYKHD